MPDDVRPTGRIDLRCPACGRMRTPIISPYFPDRVMVICRECMDRWSSKAMAREE